MRQNGYTPKIEASWKHASQHCEEGLPKNQIKVLRVPGGTAQKSLFVKIHYHAVAAPKQEVPRSPSRKTPKRRPTTRPPLLCEAQRAYRKARTPAAARSRADTLLAPAALVPVATAGRVVLGTTVGGTTWLGMVGLLVVMVLLKPDQAVE
jgi:hypothetical protein